ncbi:hypothetical protein [Haliangium ochraceum]|uniref:Uncharacterized protein n=1 Tax=Haliangium ochraceum (strain DSM 14365 / JCM 11303 / SMP-2) TaxID=502025 RepID=D0LG37_HALO1|nr:hypothetical protein [Haliangium ochraceum]ACY18062.1 hypothetical protein Hoch_5580 [Haliangium ochraceum DSM 14365]
MNTARPSQPNAAESADMRARSVDTSETETHIALTCEVSDGVAQLLRDGAPCTSEITAMAPTTIAIADFDHDGKRCRACALTIARDGVLTPWPRNADDDGCTRAAPSEQEDVLDILVVPVAFAYATTLTDDNIDAFENEWFTPTRVRVRVPPPEDERPDDPNT